MSRDGGPAAAEQLCRSGSGVEARFSAHFITGLEPGKATRGTGRARVTGDGGIARDRRRGTRVTGGARARGGGLHFDHVGRFRRDGSTRPPGLLSEGAAPLRVDLNAASAFIFTLFE